MNQPGSGTGGEFDDMEFHMDPQYEQEFRFRGLSDVGISSHGSNDNKGGFLDSNMYSSGLGYPRERGSMDATYGPYSSQYASMPVDPLHILGGTSNPRYQQPSPNISRGGMLPMPPYMQPPYYQGNYPL